MSKEKMSTAIKYAMAIGAQLFVIAATHLICNLLQLSDRALFTTVYMAGGIGTAIAIEILPNRNKQAPKTPRATSKYTSNRHAKT